MADTDPLRAALRCIGGLACYRDGHDSYATLAGKLNAIAVQVAGALNPSSSCWRCRGTGNVYYPFSEPLRGNGVSMTGWLRCPECRPAAPENKETP